MTLKLNPVLFCSVAIFGWWAKHRSYWVGGPNIEATQLSFFLVFICARGILFVTLSLAETAEEIGGPELTVE